MRLFKAHHAAAHPGAEESEGDRGRDGQVDVQEGMGLELAGHPADIPPCWLQR